LAPVGGVLNVHILDLIAGSKAQARQVTKDSGRGVRAYRFAHNGRHLLYVQDIGGDENWHLYSVDLDQVTTDSLPEPVDLTPIDGIQVRIIGTSHRRPEELVIGINDRDPSRHDPFRLDLRDRSLSRLFENPGLVGLVTDQDLEVRAGAEPRPDGSQRIVVRHPDNADDPADIGSWTGILEVPHEDALGTGVVGFDGSGQRLLLVSSVGANTSRLVEVDLISGRLDALAEDSHYDIAAVHCHPTSRQVQIVGFRRARMELQALDPSVEDDLAVLVNPSRGDLFLTSRTLDDSVWLVGYTRDAGPVEYYRFDRPSRKLEFLFSHRPDLEGFELASMEPFSYRASDGLEIHGYLSFPVDQPRRNLPTVLLVHGGPWARDTWGFDPQAQWLANRGYLCVQVNFRGSTGYGKDFVNAGDKEWGAAMQQDLTDAMAHVVEAGYADPSRLGIFGGSYGGYAALAGAAFTPNLFRCAVDLVGPSNLKTLIESVPEYWKPTIAQFHLRVGNPDTEADFLWSRSPLSRVSQIRIPLLIAQGANDPRVKQAESEQIVAALQQAGIEHEYLLYEDEGHGFARPENRLDFFSRAEAFLARHLGGRTEAQTQGPALE
jgi:dipeptidyl aminopeptidase/acylaminoacyl peptidase